MSLLIYVRNQTRQALSNVESFLQEMAKLVNPPIQEGEISILFCGDTFMRRLNQNYRGKDKSTDVLSFCAEIPNILGDIVISIPRAKKQAKQGLQNELEMLLCHGFLHLLGYDHERSKKDYDEMINLQTSLLQIKQTELHLYE